MSELALREFHSFQAAGRDFVYLVPSAAVFELDATSAAVINRLRGRSMSRADLARQLSVLFPAAEVDETIAELMRVRAIGEIGVPEESDESDAAGELPAHHHGAQRHQPVQLELHLLLRVRRRQDRRHRKRKETEVHERGNGARERGFHAARGRRK